MIAHADPIRVALGRELADRETHHVIRASEPLSKVSSQEQFASNQIHSLIQQVFLSRHACRVVVISAIDPQADVGELSLQVGRALSTETPKNVCVVTGSDSGAAKSCFDSSFSNVILSNGGSSVFYESSRQISEKLWLLPQELFWDGPGVNFAADVLSRRLDQLRATFDFAVIQAPAAGCNGIASLLGRLADGVILVIEAHQTRRIAARKTLLDLKAADARLLGIVLRGRTFPIPEKLYRRV